MSTWGASTTRQKEQWAWDTYGLGVSDAMADAQNPASPYYAPDRKISLIHRAHQADLKQIINVFSALPGRTNADSSLLFSFKYSQAHMHSSTKPQFIYQKDWFSTIPAGSKILLTVRNDDMYYLRWGDPDFARAYLTQPARPLEDRGLLHRPGRLHLGARISEHRTGCAAPTGDREDVVFLSALRPAGLRSDHSQQPLRGDPGGTFPGGLQQQTVRRLGVGLEDPAVAHPVLLGRAGFPMVSRSLLERRGIRDGGEVHQPAMGSDEGRARMATVRC